MAGSQESPKVLLLHGFLQSAQGFYRKIKPAFPEDCPAVVLQAPFPVFRQRSNRYDVGYSWFFYDSQSDTYLVKRDFAVNYCVEIIRQLGWENSLTHVVGYSQGGYLAPFVASELPGIKAVTGIHCRFRHEELKGELPFTINQLHGSDDQVVDPENSRKSHKAIIEKGNKGEFQLLEGIGHELTEPVLDRLRQVIRA